MMGKRKYKEPKHILIFNPMRVLIAIVRSLHTAAEISGRNLQAISFCCTGKYISSGGYYFRHIKPDVKIDINDLDNLRLEAYDKMCGEEREYHSSKQLSFIRDNFPNRLNIRKKPGKRKKDEVKQPPNNEG